MLLPSGLKKRVMDKSFDIRQLVRSNIRELVPYSSARDEFSGTASVFLDANENPHNPPLNRYPDPKQLELKSLIAGMKGVKVENLFLGNGSDEGIDLLFRVLCNPGSDNVITADPTYGMYGVCAGINDVQQKSVLLRPDFQPDVEGILDAVDDRTKMIFLCSPNNPTSNSLNIKDLVQIIENVNCMVVLDEAYIDFSRQRSLVSMVPEYPNLVILQTLSKAWGLAGIRLGMVFAHRDLIAYLANVKYPYNLNSLSMKTAMDALSGPNTAKHWVEQILHERELLTGILKNLHFVKEIYPSDANFLLVRVSEPKKIYSYLKQKGIIVRDRSSVPRCEGCLRITIGTGQENKLLVDALKAFSETSEID